MWFLWDFFAASLLTIQNDVPIKNFISASLHHRCAALFENREFQNKSSLQPSYQKSSGAIRQTAELLLLLFPILPFTINESNYHQLIHCSSSSTVFIGPIVYVQLPCLVRNPLGPGVGRWPWPWTALRDGVVIHAVRSCTFDSCIPQRRTPRWRWK